MEYENKRSKLLMPEYGRNIQKMVEHTVGIEDRTKRNEAAQTIITVMGNMNPHYRDIPEFKNKLWAHIALISDYKLDIDFPCDIPERELTNHKVAKIEYPSRDIRIKHYGHTIQLLIDKAIKMEEGKSKDDLIKAIANQMKKSYLIWNKDVVNDSDIIRDLGVLSNGSIKLESNFKLSENKDFLRPKKKKPTSSKTPNHKLIKKKSSNK